MAEEAIEAPPPPITRKKMSGKKIVLFFLLPLILFGGGGAAAWFLLFPHEETEGEVAVAEPTLPPVYFDMDELTVNLASTGKRTSYLKLKLTLELGAPEDQDALPNMLPRVEDQFQVYLRGVRVEDIQGSDGLQRLREELLLRAQKAAAPAKIKDILFKVVQVQ